MLNNPSHKAILLYTGFIATSQAIEVANHSNSTNDRFPFDSSFIGNNFDLSGVGRAGGAWGTAIGENYFLSANHSHPNAGENIVFTVDNLGSPISHSHTVGGGFRIGTTDLWLGYTNSAIDSSIARYAVTSQNANNLSDLGLGNDTLYLSGDQIPGSLGTVADHVLGTNQAESFYEEGSGQFATPGTTLIFNPPTGFENDMIILIENLIGDDTAPLTHEAVVEGGDSGSPLFSASGSNLTLLGTASLRLSEVSGNYVNTFGPPPLDPLEQRNASTYSYIGSYEAELAAAIARVPAVAIPEPTTLTLIVIAASLGMQRKR